MSRIINYKYGIECLKHLNQSSEKISKYSKVRNFMLTLYLLKIIDRDDGINKNIWGIINRKHLDEWK
jgi:hypothetical protein